ncbi:hypothetical protein [Clostridium cuniculi]|uniref:hypothetical protein n=1 Tax=Clostridium cuniculi TaxID=2548455 RepID=UPI0010542592|nr:hypothetical protein [Clostridium cuniculi]
MEIVKNNGKIVIEEYREANGFITSIKTINSYNITVLDLEGVEKLRGRLKVQQLKNRKNYKFSHNSNNKALIEYVLNELKKHKYIDIK